MFAAAALATTCAVLAQQPKVGAPAPAIQCEAWFNHEGAPPTLDALRGRVVLLEFWGTWCGPCVRAMPGIQKLHERYQARGLTVLAISYEPKNVLQPFLKQHGYTMAVGSDPTKATVAAYGVRGWPTTVVIDKEGDVAHVGSPYDAETAVEKALGLEAGPAALLTTWFEIQKEELPERRPALDRLCEKAIPDFDLRSWALSHVSPPPMATGGAPPGKPTPAPTPAGKPAKPAPPDAAATDHANGLLLRLMKAWHGDAAQCTTLLQQLADQAPAAFDLAVWAEQQMAMVFPLTMAEVLTMLEARQYVLLLEAIVRRNPDTHALATATKNREFTTWCRDRADSARTQAKRGLMAQHWLFANASVDETKNDEFFRELAMSGAGTSPDQKQLVSVLLDGEAITREGAAGFVHARLTEALAAADVGGGKPPRKDLKAQFAKDLAAMTKDLERRYGKPVPVRPK
jgi:peroxiredoxin